MKKENAVAVTTHVSKERMSDLLCNALEGGSNYWYRIEKFVEPPSLTFRSDPKTIFTHLDYPMNDGGALEISSLEEPEREHVMLTLDKLRKGLTLMAEKYPHHWTDFLKENDDATTGDVFLQLAVFGELVYG